MTGAGRGNKGKTSGSKMVPPVSDARGLENKNLHDHFPSALVPKKDSFGEALGPGMGAGAFAGGIVGLPFGQPLVGAAGGALVGGAISGGNWIYDQLFGGSKTGAEAGAESGTRKGAREGVIEGFGSLNTSPGKAGEPAHKMNFLQGPKQVIKPQPVSLSLNIDGRTLAQAVSEIQSALYEFPGGAPAANGLTAWNDGDHNFATT